MCCGKTKLLSATYITSFQLFAQPSSPQKKEGHFDIQENLLLLAAAIDFTHLSSAYIYVFNCLVNVS